MHKYIMAFTLSRMHVFVVLIGNFKLIIWMISFLRCKCSFLHNFIFKMIWHTHHTHTHKYTHTCTSHTQAHTYTSRTYTYTNICTHTSHIIHIYILHTYTHHTHSYTHIHRHTHITYTHIHRHIHTYTHTHTQLCEHQTLDSLIHPWAQKVNFLSTVNLWFCLVYGPSSPSSTWISIVSKWMGMMLGTLELA